MNLSITPVNFNNYSAARNCRNNNQSQNFEALPVTVFRHPAETGDVLRAFEKRDKVIDVFTGVLEEAAKRLGINTDKMAEEGFSLVAIPKFRHSSKMRVDLVDKHHDVVTFSRHNKPITANISSASLNGNPYGLASSEAEDFAYMLKRARLGKD